MPGPQLQRSEINACLKIVLSDATPEYIAVSGSLPRGAGPDLIGEIADLARRHQIRLCIDTSGEPLREAVRQGVFLLKPNMRELGSITNENLSTEAGQEKALRSLIDEGRCELIVLSLGAAGVLMATSDGVERVRAPTVPINSRVGAGDSMVAGILTGLCRGYPLPKAVRLGVAAGSAAVMTPGTQLCRRKETEELFDEMTNQIGF
jgi:6-phosphofructokinase 2